VSVLGPGGGVPTLPVVTFTVEGLPHALVAARLSAEFGIGVRHGCFCAHPYLIRLLGLSADDVAAYREDVRRGERRFIPGAIRASASLSTTREDVDRLADALRHVTDGTPPPVDYVQDVRTGDFHVRGHGESVTDASRRIGAGCARG
jgi:selenocysteine lyase/cysteine desulfurase